MRKTTLSAQVTETREVDLDLTNFGDGSFTITVDGKSYYVGPGQLDVLQWFASQSKSDADVTDLLNEIGDLPETKRYRLSDGTVVRTATPEILRNFDPVLVDDDN